MSCATAAIAESFSRAAHSYESANDLQLAVGQELLALLPSQAQPQAWLDLGCGTGAFCAQLRHRFPQAQGVAVDIAPAMLQLARERAQADVFVCADAASLPLAPASVDLVFSNFVLQWCADFPAVLQQAYQVLKPGGWLLFSSVLDGSLAELKHSWQQVDSQQHVNEFRAFDTYLASCEASDFAVQDLQQITRVQHWPQTRDILLSLKQIGATHLQQGRSAGLLSSQRYRRLQQAYEQLRQPEGLPLSWQLVLGVLRKPLGSSHA